MADKLPFQITPGTPNDDSVVHASDADESDLSRSHNERGISRLQGTSPAYSSSKTYNINDIVEESENVYRCTVAIGTPETFDRSKWNLVWETLDVVRVFTEEDLPDVVGSTHLLEDGKDYRFTQSINLVNGLLLPVGGTVALTSESKQAVIIDTDGVNFVNSFNNFVPYTVVADSGGDLLFTVPTMANAYSPGDLVNIQTLTGTDYTQIKATIITVPNSTSFTIAGTFVATGTGNTDRGALNVLVDGLNVNNLNPSGGITAFEINMTRAEQSFIEFTNTTIQGFLQLGPLTNANELYFEHNKIFSNIDSLKIIRCEVVNIADCYFEAATNSLNSLNIEGQDVIQHYTISNCTFNPTDAATAAIEVDPTDMSDSANISVFNCIDLNVANDSLFDTSGSGLDETDPRLTVNGNVRQKNSLSTITIEFPFSAGPLNIAVAANTLTAVSSTAWIENFSERFSLNTGAVTGEFTYNGLETAQFLITYHAELMPESDAQELFAGIFLNATEIPESRFTIDAVAISTSRFIAHSFIVMLETDDVLRFGVGNVNTAEDVYVANMATITVTRIT